MGGLLKCWNSPTKRKLHQYETNINMLGLDWLFKFDWKIWKICEPHSWTNPVAPASPFLKTPIKNLISNHIQPWNINHKFLAYGCLYTLSPWTPTKIGWRSGATAFQAQANQWKILFSLTTSDRSIRENMCLLKSRPLRSQYDAGSKLCRKRTCDFHATSSCKGFHFSPLFASFSLHSSFLGTTSEHRNTYGHISMPGHCKKVCKDPQPINEHLREGRAVEKMV